MQIKLTTDRFQSSLIPDPKKGAVHTVSPEIGAHLVRAGVAIALKVEEPLKTKVGSASPRVQVSTKKTATKRKAKAKPLQ